MDQPVLLDAEINKTAKVGNVGHDSFTTIPPSHRRWFAGKDRTPAVSRSSGVSAGFLKLLKDIG